MFKNAEIQAVAEFRAAVEKFSALMNIQGTSVAPYEVEGITHFPRLTPEMQAATLSNFRRYVGVCESATRAGSGVTDEIQLLWRMFHELGVHPVIDLMRAIGPNDIIEVYNASLIQVFRSMNFFSVCSYTLDELICRPFWDLYRRDDEVTQLLLGVVDDILKERVRGVHAWSIGDHELREIASRRKYRAKVRNKIISPLYDSTGRVASFVHTFEILSLEPTVSPQLR